MKKFVTLLIMVAGLSCTRIDEPIRIDNDPVSVDAASGSAPTKTRSGETPTFDTLPNPYDLNVMQAVYDMNGGGVVLTPTHLYVRFLPQNKDQLDLLEDTYNLALFDYPLELDIPDDEEYIDPTIPEGEFTWQYTTVELNFTFPAGITYEILKKCYIPEDDEVIEPKTREGESVIVEKAAFELLGYVVDPDPLTRSGGGGGQKPTGTVTVWDDINNAYVPVKGVRMKVNSLTKVNRVYTDENGKYTMTQKFWDKNVNYVVVFKNAYDFIIWDKIGHRAKYKPGKYSKYGASFEISKSSGEVWKWAAINNGAYDHYKMCATTGIARPPEGLRILLWGNGSSAPMIRRLPATKIISKSQWATFFSVFASVVVVPVLVVESLFKFLEPDVTIDESNSSYSDYYETTNHEVGHASHFSQAGKDYWARYVGYIIDSKLSGKGTYGDGTGTNAGVCAVGEMWGYSMGYLNLYGYFGWTLGTFPDNVGWIKPDVFWDLYRNGVLTKKQIYDCLTSDVDTPQKLIDKMCTKYPAKTVTIRNTFAAYGIGSTVEGYVSLTSQTFNSNYSVSALVIDVQNLTVNSPAKLTLNGQTSVTIMHPFIINSGAQLEISH